ncbi:MULTISPECIES: DEAD/DEAH box helicase [unclassified Streptomyces]|uniref:DEAD/DEAH box helicase n=1 Tax=unclassified Streptomyces TaxID=2593676 RepID=UPI000CD4E34E|nr:MULTISPECIES: DEAD/DEAH box helicase [unclassified Streptomyces]
MRPTLAAQQVRDSLSQYLATTYALADESTRGALEHFLGDAEDGIFRGPYLRVRTPFRPAADDSWQRHLQWWPQEFRPHHHQAAAWRRLSTLDGPARPTLVTTGTGSGKTESFLVPLLDHCRRAREAGQTGVKAVLLYPMNALATDQAHRINNHLDNARDTRLRDAGVRAGLYIGDKPSEEFRQANPRVAVDRDEIRATRPDILITNYKMLDLLLQRKADHRLWAGGTDGSAGDTAGAESSLAYVVLDEFHTYDGAQGTDVAMLLRRLGSVTGIARPGAPLGDVTPVATSATLGQGGDTSATEAMLRVAEQVFGTAFPPDAVISENRRTAADFCEDVDYALPFPAPHEVDTLGDPSRDPAALRALSAAFTGYENLTPAELGAALRRHRMTTAVLEVLDGRPLTAPELLDALARKVYHWGMAIARTPGIAARALARYVALLSVARDPDHPDRPLLSIEVHHWVRSVSRVLRGISSARPEFRWDDERVRAGTAAPSPRRSAGPGPVPGAGEAEPVPAADSAPSPAQAFLPAIFCRECGRSGWAALSPEADPAELQMDAAKIRRSTLGRDKRRVRYMIAATGQQAHDAAFTAERSRSGPTVMVLEGLSGRLRPLSPEADFGPPDEDGGPRTPRVPQDAAFVVIDLADDRAARVDQCPACRTNNAIRFLGTGLAPLASAAVTQLFTGGELDKDIGENKTLLFNDSVQDAAHRAGYVASRSYTFSLRSLLASRIPEDEPIALNDLAADLIADVAESRAAQAAVIPPDLHTVRGVDILLSGRSHGSQPTWELIAQRLAFATVMEFGLRSRQGRTLELTRTVAADVPLTEEETEAVSETVRELLTTTPGDIALPGGGVPGPEEWLHHVRGLLERMRTRGAVRHRWLEPWLHDAGVRRWQIWGGRPPGMPAFPRGVSAPSFVLSGPKAGSEDFDVVTGRLGWYQDWARRSLGLRQDAATAFLARLLPALAELGVVSEQTTRDGATRVWGLQPGHVHVRRLTDDAVADAVAHCATCSWQQTVHPDLADQWHGRPCPRYRCGGSLRTGRDPDSGVRRRDYTADFYRRMYREAGVYTINTAEHTGTLSRSRREAVEKAFREGTAAHYANPQVLSCTPTLELGIDIGDLSAVVLASLPKGPANYVQRVGRAGRATGNSYLLTLVDRRPRDRYYLEDPRQMIAGDIQPPGCYLSAVEILRRQYLAHLLDLTAAGRLPLHDGAEGADGAAEDGAVPVGPMPHRASELFDRGSWLAEFRDAALAEGAGIVNGFLALFPPYDTVSGIGVSLEAEAELRAFAVDELGEALASAREAWEARRAALHERMRTIEAAQGDLVDGDPEHEEQRRTLRAEGRALGRQVRDLSRGTAHGALVELGLLPNYSLIDSATELEATLLWTETRADGSVEHHSTILRYERAARFALSDLAPGNHFYVQGYRHEVTGLDIGSPQRPAWQWWRICPGCGHTRTHRAEQDTSVCPRCGSPALGDVGCLHRVLVPRRVTSRDKRDDARVKDDKDERERRSYTVVPTVDIADGHIESSFRHRQATFGWEFTRRAVVRHLNVGASRAEIGAEETFAGRPARLNPFWVCDSCGFADPDGGPAAASPGRVGDFHRPWCRRLRQDRNASPDAATRGLAMLLAHELESEALRLLVPAVTAHAPERLATFKALLLAGIARTYGGDPDHLDVVSTSMPESDGENRRHFLVLYDTLPRGTGYLHRLADPAGLREVLRQARQVVDGCRCLGEERPACHRCLLRHVDGAEYQLVSREHATDILQELLGTDDAAWAVDRVGTVREVSLAPQLESELEALFRRELLSWAERAEEVSLRNAVAPDGRQDTTLRFTGADGTVRGWQMETQTDLGNTVPDVVFRSLDDDRRVAVYLDGYRYHASPTHNRAAKDAEQRTGLRANGWRVFQLTWDDVRVWAGIASPPASPAWQPYHHTAQRAAADIHRRQYRSDPRELPRLVWANPVSSLLGYLTDPDDARWRRCVQSALAGFAPVAATSAALADGPAVAERLREALAGGRVAGGAGQVQVLATRDASGLPLAIALDTRRGMNAAVWSALAVLDDSPGALERDEQAHQARWRAWLYWSNLMQFLDTGDGEGDGAQLTTSDLPDFDPLTLAVTGGVGLLESRAREVVPAPAPGGVAETGADRDAEQTADRDPGWDDVLDLLVEEEALRDLAERLAARGVPAPHDGYELGSAGWQTELAWPDRRVGVVLAHVPGPDGEPDQESQDRDAAYAAAGWDVRPARGWDAAELAKILMRGDNDDA